MIIVILTELNQQTTDNQATKYSNFNSEFLERDDKMIVTREGLEGSRPPDQNQNIQAATEFSNTRYNTPLATKFSSKNQLKQYWSKRLPGGNKCLKQVTSGIIYQLVPDIGELEGPEPKYYINNPSSLIETAVSSGGVEVIN